MQPTSLAVTPAAPGADAPEATAAPALTLAADTRSVRQAALIGMEVIDMARHRLRLVMSLVVLAAAQTHANVIHVPAGQPTIQQGLDAAAEGDTVLVAPGTYTGSLNTGLDFGGVNICLISESGPDVTIIDCEHSLPRAIWLRSGEDPSSLIEGFTICNGSGTAYGAGMRCLGSSPTIRDCVFTGCYAGGAGGGLCVESDQPILLEDVVFRDNDVWGQGAGVHFWEGSTATLRRCVFEGNRATPPAGGAGGGLSCLLSTIELEDCVFVSNSASYQGSGARIQSSHATLVRCSFVGNSHTPPYGTCEGGGLCVSQSDGEARNCTFIENKAYTGGGAFVRGWSPISFSFVGCTFALCGSGLGAGMAVEGPATAVLDRTIIAFSDYGNAVKCWGEGAFSITCSDFYGSTGEDWPPCVADQLGVSGNISADPLFCDLSARDLTLAENSPCAPIANPVCGLVGAWEVGCAATPVRAISWGAIKGLYGQR